MKPGIKIGLAGLFAASVGGLALWWAYSSLVRRASRVVIDLPPYGDELRSLTSYADSPATKPSGDACSGPGWYPRCSPDRTRVALTTSWGGFFGDVFLGLLIDRPYIHTVSVWDTRAQRLTPVVSIKEADPHSGIAHRYTWSKDSSALLIYGSGRLPEDYDVLIGDLCLVYLPSRDDLVRLADCPPAWQRGPGERSGAAGR